MTLKPGTRCECTTNHPSLDNPDWTYWHGEKQCDCDAVRLVTVTVEIPGMADELERIFGARPGSATETKRVPMCEPCAAFHESKVTK